MKRSPKRWHARLTVIGLAAGALVLLSSCARLDRAWVPGSAESLARDQIMLVRQEPPSFGFHRLVTQSGTYPDFALFVQRQGIPDFLAETGNLDRHYFILYYLGPRKAYACRTRPGHPKAVEFSGPYHITAREYRMLDGFRRAIRS